jgi:hypothetical protein
MIAAIKLLLTGYENMTGLKIDYSKSELIPLNITEHKGISLANIIGYKVGNLPIKYLGVPPYWKRLRNSD